MSHKRCICFIFLTIQILVSLSACTTKVNEVSRTESDGLVVEFSVICQEGDIWLSSTIENRRSEKVALESGALPWQYDPLGTRFTAFAGGTELQRHGGIPFSDRFAPKVLAPGERQAGSTPIGYMFPDIKKALGNQKVVVQWKYSDQLHGELQINRNPCK